MFLKILRSVEEVIYELALWVALLPKTLLKVLVNPGWVHDYVSRQHLETADKRYDDYFSPVMFWLVLAVVPYVWHLDSTMASNLPIDVVFREMKFEERTAAAAIFLLSFPAGGAIVLQKLKGEQITRSSLERVFHMQCLVAAPFQLASVPFALSAHYGPILIEVLQGASVIWYLGAQTAIFSRELRIRPWRGLLFAGGTVLLIYFVTVAIVLFVVFAFYVQPLAEIFAK